MKVKLSFVFLLVTISILSYYFPVSVGFEKEKDPFAMVEKNGVTAMNDFFDFFNNENKHEIEIVISKTQLDMMDEAMEEQYAKYGNYRSSLNVKADFIYKENDIVKYTFEDVGIRTNGNGKALGLNDYEDGLINLNNFKITFDETFELDETSALYNEYKDRTFLGMDNLNLKFNKTGTKEIDGKNSYINEVYAYKLYNEAGVYAPYASNGNVVLNIHGNKINMGIYSLIENIDQKFIDKRFSKKANDGNLYKCLYREGVYANLDLIPVDRIGDKDEESDYYPTYDIKTNKSTNHGEDLIEFTSRLNQLSGNELKLYLDGVLDIDNFMRFNAISYLLGNIDDFRYRGNNYYLYINSKNNKMYFIPQDLDYVLGQYGELAYFSSNFASIDVYSDWTLMEQKNILLSKTLLLLEDNSFNDYRNLYEKYIENFSETLFIYEDYVSEYQTIRAHYKDIVKTTKVRLVTPLLGLNQVVEDFFTLKHETVKEVID